MNNIKYYPFERNNYFYGKLLTVSDFNEEQRYMNDKRRIGNVFHQGIGVVAGMRVQAIDDQTISIGAGMALDGLGREIIIPEGITKKISVIDGFAGLSNLDTAYLMVRYKEENKEAVYTVANTQGENNFNRVAESYELYMTNKINEASVLGMKQLKYSEQVVYDNNGLKVTQIMPRFVKANETFEVKVIVEKINLQKSVEVDYIMESEFFVDAEDNKRLRVYYSDDDFKAYKKTELVYTLTAKSANEQDVQIVLDANVSRISVGVEKEQIPTNIKIAFQIVTGDDKEQIIASHLERYFEDVVSLNMKQEICLCQMRIVKTEREFSAIHIENLPFAQYVLSNQMLYTLLQDGGKKIETKIAEMQVAPVVPKEPEQRVLSGKEEIYIDLKSKNKTYYSDEIAHGLGAGNTFIEVALEENAAGFIVSSQQSVYFGDVEILEDDIYGSMLPKVKMAVVSYPMKGTFRIAIKVLEDSDFNSLTILWWAMQNEKAKQINYAEISGVQVKVSPDTVTMKPKEKMKFSAEVIGTDSQDCRYSVVEQNGGSIGVTGLYEAPSTEGVYEVLVESVKYPNKKATAFVIVKDK